MADPNGPSPGKSAPVLVPHTDDHALRNLVDIERLEGSLTELVATYRDAEPYPYVMLDNFLLPGVVERAAGEFPTPDSPDWRNYTHVNERKYGNVHVHTWGPLLQELAFALTCDRFCRFLDELTGFDGLLPDLTMDGGGLHQSRRGGYLNVHADFTAHHTEQTWRRRVNLLLYLNPEWDPEWGSALGLWSRDMSRCETTVAPLGNRVVIFTTNEDSFHGHPAPLDCPEDVVRKSMALYYFTDDGAPLVKSTNFRPQAGDKFVTRTAIALDRGVLAVYDKVKRRLKLDDATVSRILGRIGDRRRKR
jgi:hypothetical protein